MNNLLMHDRRYTVPSDGQKPVIWLILGLSLTALGFVMLAMTLALNR